MFIASVIFIAGILFTATATTAKNGVVVFDIDVGDKQFHLTTNSANYEGGAQNCQDIHGGTLVNIESDEEREAVYRLTIAGCHDVATVWVGGSVKRGCGAPQQFNSSCWEWNNKQPINASLWIDGIERKNQTAMSRAVYSVILDKLDIVGNTAIHQFVCESAVDKC